MAIEWMLVLYSLFMGLSIGPFALLALTDASEKRPALFKWSSLLGLLIIVVAGIFAFLHLQAPLAAVYVFSNFNSPIAQEAVIVLVTGLVAALLAGMALFNWMPGLRRAVAWLGLVLAVISVLFIANIYLLPVRPAWNTWLLPLTLLASSLINGLLLTMALIALVPSGTGEDDRSSLKVIFQKWALPVLAVYAILAVAFFLLAANKSGGILRLLGGDLALMFWLGLIVVGLAAPAYLLWASKKDTQTSLLAAFILVFIGGLVVRVMLFPLGTRVLINTLW